MREGSVYTVNSFGVEIVVWLLPLLALAPVVNVFSNSNLAPSFSGENEGCTTRGVGLPSP